MVQEVHEQMLKNLKIKPARSWKNKNMEILIYHIKNAYSSCLHSTIEALSDMFLPSDAKANTQNSQWPSNNHVTVLYQWNRKIYTVASDFSNDTLIKTAPQQTEQCNECLITVSVFWQDHQLSWGIYALLLSAVLNWSREGTKFLLTDKLEGTASEDLQGFYL